MNCPVCGGPLIRRNRALLVAVGTALAAAALALDFVSLAFLLPALLLLAAGGYLVMWGTYGQGLWCRACKTFPAGKLRS